MKNKHIVLKYFIIITSMIFIVVLINVNTIKTGYYIEKETHEIKNLISQNDYLLKEINKFVSPKNIEIHAFKMGLKYPEPYSIVILNEKTTSKNSNILLKWLVKKLNNKIGTTGS